VLAAVLLLAALQTPDTTTIPRDSYADSATAQLVHRARAARDRNERLVTAYTAKVSQRIGVGIRALARDRMLYRQEMVAKISWRRDSVSTIEVVGAREGIPIAIRGDRIPEDLDDELRGLVLNPAEDYLRVIGAQDDDGFVYPLKVGGEADYRFAVGDTTKISLPSGKVIRLAALRVIPRRADWRLMSGTLWFDLDTYGLVRAVFRPARPYEFRRDSDPEDREDVPAFVNPKAEVKYVTLEYGFYENRWWLPRYVAIDAYGTMGSWLNVPVKIERVYDDYEVEGGTPPDPNSDFRPAGTVRRSVADTIADPVEAKRVADSVQAAVRGCLKEAERDEDVNWRDAESRRRYRERIRQCTHRSRDTTLTFVIPSDTAALVTSSELGPPILDMGDLINEQELRSFGDALGKLPGTPWQAHLELPHGVGALLQNARYNRVEALSLGARGTLDLGKLALEGSARIGLADFVPNAEVHVARSSPTTRWALGGYRRLAAANPDAHPFGAVNSTMSLLAQRDDGQYFRSLGAEVTVENTASGWWTARLYLERQRPARVETKASLPYLFNNSKTFGPNIAADSAVEAGFALTLRGTKVFSHSFSVGAQTTVDGATGDYDFGRAALTLRAFITPPGPLAGALTAAAGTSTGPVPIQSAFFLGGPSTLRGYNGGVLSGSAFWLARAEIGNSFPAARITAFSDVGWAGDRAGFSSGRPLISVGMGASFLDGLVRIDLARGLRAPTGWRLDFYFDGVI